MKKLEQWFKKLVASLKKAKGFTLIELLVVIGILGILAAALVATIDPFEQLKKGQDTNVKNVLVEFNNATVRYYTTHNTFPWSADAPEARACNANGAGRAITALRLSDGTTTDDCVDTLIADKELKSSFNTAHQQLKEIYVTEDMTNNVIIGCFEPQSRSQKRDLNTKYDINGVDVANPTTNCEGYGGATVCYWCTR